ncbi:MAG: hypothetical protein FJW79_05005 [Actinobacteria bacterium]|nr:hypothetical protein [Actinomycetota bacterium]
MLVALLVVALGGVAGWVGGRLAADEALGTTTTTAPPASAAAEVFGLSDAELVWCRFRAQYVATAAARLSLPGIPDLGLWLRLEPPGYQMSAETVEALNAWMLDYPEGFRRACAAAYEVWGHLP